MAARACSASESCAHVQEKTQFNQLQIQNTANLYRKTAFRELLGGLSGVSAKSDDMYKLSLAVR